LGAEAAPRDWRGMMGDVVVFGWVVGDARDAENFLVEMCLVGENLETLVLLMGDARLTAKNKVARLQADWFLGIARLLIVALLEYLRKADHLHT